MSSLTKERTFDDEGRGMKDENREKSGIIIIMINGNRRSVLFVFRDSVASRWRLLIFVFRSLEPQKQYGFLFFVRIRKKIYIYIYIYCRRIACKINDLLSL